jgi:hypothetical protein
MRQRVRKKPMEGATAPLVLGIMRDKDQDARSRLDAAKAAAPSGTRNPRSVSKWI